jgi:uncharacterized protein (DUF433 family)
LNLLNLTPEEAAALQAEAGDRSALYRRGLDRIESRRDMRGGEPAFKGTRLSIRHIGGMALNGAPDADIRTDYPQLS